MGIIEPSDDKRRQHRCKYLIGMKYGHYKPNGTLASCPTCGTWYYKSAGSWYPVRRYHWRMNKRIWEVKSASEDKD